MKNIVIGIEGLVGAGKTSICRELLNKIPNSILLNGGNLYRAILTVLLNQNIDIKSLVQKAKDLDIKEVMNKLGIEIKIEDKETVFYCNGKKLEEEELQSVKSSMAVSSVGGIADNTALFKFAKDFIDNLKKQFNVIISGRSLMQIYPEMDYHLFITASLEQRVLRKSAQYEGKMDIKELEEHICKRDMLQEKAGFYKISPNTITIDVTDCESVEASTQKVLEHIKNFNNKLKDVNFMEYENTKLTEFCNYIKNKKVAIIGLGVSNIPLLDYLHSLGAKITVFDKRDIDKISKDILDKITENNIQFSFGPNNLSNLVGFDIIFRSPSCRPDIPEILSELDKGAILTSEIEMLIELCPGTVIGITGSDGKTTTTTLIYEILKEKGYNCYLGGNIGIPLFSKIGEMKPDDYVVLELSSFQLMNMKTSPKISVITNITPNHLDIHKSYEEYIESKKNIFKYQDKDGILVTNYDNEITREFDKEAPGKVIFFSKTTKLNDGIILDKGIIKECEDKLRKHILDTRNMCLRGEHNHENACTAIAATKSLVDTETQVKVISNFKGVEHRLEFVRELNGVKWYNDSIGTSPTRTIAGLKSFDENIVLIAGGYDKHLDYTPIAMPILDNVSDLILMGQTAKKIKEAVENAMKATGKKINIYECDTLDETIKKAKQVAQKGDVVLFSPASASFDLYKNFEERGNKFKQGVLDL